MKNNQLSYLYILCLYLLSSCEKLDEVLPLTSQDKILTSKDYIIEKDTHRSTSSLEKVELNSLKFKAIFDNSAKYITQDPNNQADINKLFGFSDCDSHHHTNSARFGWRWFNDQLEIHAYTYVDGTRAHQLISSVDINIEYKYEIKIEDNQYTFKVNGSEVEMPRGCTGTASGYKLYPYFGGDEAAPSNIIIKITELK